MTKSSLACSLVLALALTACASDPKSVPSGSTAAPTAGTSPTTAQASTKPKLQCEEVKPLGSNLPQRICMTPEEAAARQKAAQDRVRNMQNQSAVGPGQNSSSGG